MSKKTSSNIALAIKASLKVENRKQYTKRQMNNAIKNQVYSKKSQYTEADLGLLQHPRWSAL